MTQPTPVTAAELDKGLCGKHTSTQFTVSLGTKASDHSVNAADLLQMLDKAGFAVVRK